MRVPTTERRRGQLTGNHNAECTVMINKVDGVETLRAISDVTPQLPDGSYTLTVQGASSSQWVLLRGVWTSLTA